MSIEKKLRKLAAEILPPDSSNAITKHGFFHIHRNEADDWAQGIMDENGAEYCYAGQIYGSSQGPDISHIICNDIGETVAAPIYTEDIAALEDYIVQIAEKKFSGYFCFVTLDDNCLWLFAMPE